MNSRYFIGSILVLLGLIFLYEELFDKDLPILQILIPLVLIGIGAQLIIGSQNTGNQEEGASINPVIFSSGKHKVKSENFQSSYVVIFGEQKIDLTELQTPEKHQEINIITIFGDTKVFVPPSINWKIQGSVLLGEQTFPDGREKNFGDDHYNRPDFDPDQPHLLLDCKTLFGEMKVFEAENKNMAS